MARFFLSLKIKRVQQRDDPNHGEAMRDVTDYILGFYNACRLHSKLGNQFFNAFERKMAARVLIDAS